MKATKPNSFDDLYREAETHDDYWLAGCVQELTEEIFERMEREGITRSELARRLGTSPAYVTKILRGNTNFTLATLVRLARALGTELRVQFEPVTRDQRASARSTSRRRRSLPGSRNRAPALAAAPPSGRGSTR